MRRTGVFSAILVLFMAAYALADAPQVISYQGYLTDNLGDPITATVSLVFTIYDAETGGLSKWTETHSSVDVVDGLFNVILGEGTPPVPIDPSDFDSPDRYLGIKVGADPELTQRTRLTSVPYSANAQNGGGWDNVGTRVKLQSDNDQVRIGYPGTLGLDGFDFVVSGTDGGSGADIFLGTGNSPPENMRIRFRDSFQYWDIISNNVSDDELQFVHPDGGGTPIARMTLLRDGNVGIGTTTPARTLHVNSVMRLQPRASAPSSPSEGDMYMNSTTHKLMVYDGSTWQPCW